MITSLQALATIALEAVLIYAAARSHGPDLLRGLAVINLLMVALCSPKLFEMMGVVTNVTSIMYAAVFLIQGVVLMNFGRKATYWTIEMAILSLVCFYGLWFMISQFPSTADATSLETSKAIAVMTAAMSKNILASLTSFIISTVAMVETYAAARIRRFGRLSSFATGMVVGQLVDSILFFTVAFHTLPSDEQLELMAVGFVLKVILGLCYLPIVSCINGRIERNRREDKICPIL